MIVNALLLFGMLGWVFNAAVQTAQRRTPWVALAQFIAAFVCGVFLISRVN